MSHIDGYELDALRADAKRWQWMRAHWDNLDGHHDIWDSDGTPEGLDAAVDAAIAQDRASRIPGTIPRPGG